MQTEDIKNLIEQGLKGAEVDVKGDGAHFYATVIHPEFANKSRIQKQKLVYATLGDRIDTGSIHAISIKTFTPEEWQLHKEP